MPIDDFEVAMRLTVGVLGERNNTCAIVTPPVKLLLKHADPQTRPDHLPLHFPCFNTFGLIARDGGESVAAGE